MLNAELPQDPAVPSEVYTKGGKKKKLWPQKKWDIKIWGIIYNIQRAKTTQMFTN
jgi:hypothetical protein